MCFGHSSPLQKCSKENIKIMQIQQTNVYSLLQIKEKKIEEKFNPSLKRM